MKRLDQVEARTLIESLPFTITEPGSYYLTTNLTGAAQEDGLIIEASHVTVDLNGFILGGVLGAGDGVTVSGPRRNVSLRNGVVTGWKMGINASSAAFSQFESLQITGNTGTGLNVGERSSVQNCISAENGGAGIVVRRDSRIESSSALSNLGNGIVLEGSAQVIRSVASSNQGNGITAASRSLVSYTSTLNNQSSGIAGGAGVHIENSKSAHNGSSGFAAGNNAHIRESSASQNGTDGISAGEGSKIRDSHGVRNGGCGIRAGPGSSVVDCTVEGNGAAGIQVQSDSLVRGNLARNNFNARDAAGIRVTGSDNSIQDNSVIANDRGLSVEAPGNLILKNSAANNSINFFINGLQTKGPILSGEAETPHPWANFEF